MIFSFLLDCLVERKLDMGLELCIGSPMGGEREYDADPIVELVDSRHWKLLLLVKLAKLLRRNVE